jgi:hypothetical protein
MLSSIDDIIMGGYEGGHPLQLFVGVFFGERKGSVLVCFCSFGFCN